MWRKIMAQQVLRIKIYQSDAHYRIPFSYQRRFTYPIPPHSTVKGLICNVMGIKSSEDEKFINLKQGLSLAIYGTYESLVKEYLWFRNLEKDSHISKFKSVKNRTVDNIPNHPGGQMPVTVDVLHNVDLIVYVYHPELMEEIKEVFENPSDRLSTLHLGRAEDWIVIKEIDMINVIKDNVSQLSFFAWIPSPADIDDELIPDKENYEKFYTQVNGNLFRLPIFYEITNSNQRIFNRYIEAKLFEKGGFRKQSFYMDSELKIPLFFAKLRAD
jgi:CRISPR-associated protein Cas5t